MSIIAIAGGTGKLGRAILDGLSAQGGAEVVVLARESSPERERSIGAKILAVDYSDVDALSKILNDNNIHTVISTLDANAGPELEFNLIAAAEKATTVKRLIPNQWGIPLTEAEVPYFSVARQKIDTLKALEAGTLEWTSVFNGFFADYWFAPKVKSYFNLLPLVIDITSDTAAIPGDGNVPVTFTHTSDIAKYVAQLVTLPKWEKSYTIIGDKVTLNDFVSIVEKAKQTKFTVHHDSVETLSKGEITELPSHAHLYPFFPKPALQGLFSAFGRFFAEGLFDLKPEDNQSLNHLFPDIKPKSIQQMTDVAWKV